MVFVQEKFALQHMLTGYRKVFMMKLLTITVPSYNSEAYLDRCMATLLPGGDEVEILIVDDGSTDRTAEIADEYERKYPNIVRAIHKENGGHGDAVTTGIRNATGLFFKVVDSDDWVDERTLPKMIKCIMDGLLPISERAKELMHKHFGEDADFYIGLDPAILLGDPEVVTAGIIFIPITLLIAVIMPGNRILPFGDLATIGFFIAMAVAVHKGNLFRTLISGSCIMAMTIWITNQAVDWTTALGQSVGAVEKGATLAAMDQGGCPITYIFTQLFTRDNIPGLVIIAAIYAVSMVFAVMHSKKRAAEFAAAEEEF